MDPIIASDNTETALVPHGETVAEEEEQSQEYSSSEDEELQDLPPGPVDPEKCSVGGPGTTGGSAQAPVSFYIQARDSRDTRITEGGDYVVVRVCPGSAARAGGAQEAQAIVKDNSDGSYTATYSVEARGDYELTVEINGSAIGGSPFPVFFSPPEERPAGEAAVFTDASGAPVDAGTVMAAANVPMPVISILGAQAYAAKVEFPKDEEALGCTVLVGSMNPQVTIEQLTQLFSYSGKVTKCEFAGEAKQFALIEFASPKEAEQALTMDKLNVIDRQIRVEPAKTAFESKGQSGGTQFAALQLQQIQQLQKAQMEQHSLAAQVAQMRVQAKQNPNAFIPGLPQNSASQKAAALTAIAALSKRLTGTSHGGAAGAGPPPPDPPAAGPPKRRREVSPTLRYRSDKRTRSPVRRRSSPPRRRSPLPRRRSPVVRLRSPERRHASRDRRRDSSRDRRRRSRSRRPDRDEDGRSRSRRDVDRDRRHRREHSRSAERTRHSEKVAEKTREQGEPGRDANGSGLQQSAGRSAEIDGKDDRSSPSHRREDKSRRRDRDEERSERRHRSSKEERHDERDQAGPQLVGENSAASEATEKVREAQELRAQALEALRSMPSLNHNDSNMPAEDSDLKEPEPEKGEALRDNKRERKSKHHKKEKHSRKEKRQKREAEPESLSDTTLPEIEPTD